MKDQWLTPKDVAERCGLSPSTIKSYRYLEQMPEPDHMFSRTPVWKAETIDEWENNRRKLLANRTSKEG